MLVSLEDWIGVPLLGAEGQIGKVEDFLFEDDTWTVGHLVIDAGNWLGPREVVVPVSVLETPAADVKAFVSHLSKDELRKSPGLDSTKPVWRQQEIALKAYYGFPASWGTTTTELPPVKVAAGREFPVPSNDDPHLRSVQEVVGYTVWSDGDLIGRVENCILNEGSWRIGHLEVRAGDWLRSRSVLVSTRWVRSISWGDHTLRLDNEAEGR